MKRVCLFVSMFVLLPLSAFAQRVPPVPPVPPAPPAPAVAPIPPVPPISPVPPMPAMLIDQQAIEDAMRLAGDKMTLAGDALRLVDIDSLRPAMADEMRAMQSEAQAMAKQAAAASTVSKERAAEMAARAAVDMQMSMARGLGGSYESGLSALGAKDYERAIARFDQVIAAKDSRADGAMYHKAYAQFRLGKTDDAEATINDLRKTYPQSRYLNDVKVLEADVRKQAGHPVRPEDANDDDIKLLAIQGIQNSDPSRAVPLLQGVLSGNNSLSVKKRALYVLALSDQPEAHKILLDYAKGAGNPDLQRQAISYLASSSRRTPTTSTELQQIWDSTQDVEIKSAILSAWRSSGDTNAIFRVAGMDSAPLTIRQQAVSGLGAPELWTLYQKETNHDLKLQMLSTFGSIGAYEQLSQVARSEKDPVLKQRAIRSLGNMKADKSGALLVEMYGADSDKDTRKAIASALENQNNADGLVGIARKETDSTLKVDIVRHLVNMAGRSKVAADYLMELIK